MTKLRDARKRAGLGLAEFAYLVGVDESHCSKGERGFRRFSLEARKRIANVLGVKPEELFDEDGRAKE